LYRLVVDSAAVRLVVIVVGRLSLLIVDRRRQVG
jgi:hypothetical protein